MKYAAALAALLFSALAPRTGRADGETFTFEFLTAAPAVFEGASATPFGPFDVVAAIRPEGISGRIGAEAWTLAVTHDPAVELIQVSVEGTTAGELLQGDGAFLLVELVPGKDGSDPGFILKAALPATATATLPPDRIATVASATYRGLHPAVTAVAERTLEFRFADRLEGSGGPVENGVRWKETLLTPRRTALARMMRTIPTCSADLRLSIGSPGSVEEDGAMVLRVEAPAGAEVLVPATVRLASSLPGTSGVEAWSLSVRHDASFFEILGATTEGTDAEALADPIMSFSKTEIVESEGGTGFISAVILSLAAPRSLPASGEFTIARALYRLAAPHDQPGPIETTAIRFQEGLKEDPTPVTTILTVGGKTEAACRQDPLRLVARIRRASPVFVRGDFNDDAHIDIADAVSLVRYLFFAGRAAACPAGADANGDLRIDFSDPIFILSFLFLSGDVLPAPFPRCAPGPIVDDPLPCDEDLVRCP